MSTTRTITPTPTPSPSPTISATPACTVVTIATASLVGRLSDGDCIRTVNGLPKPSDAYVLNVGANQEVALNVVTRDASLQPYVVVTDPGGRFGQVQGRPPLRFSSIDAVQYSLIVSTAADSPQELGDYQLEVPIRTCPAPLSLGVPGARSASIAGDECTDPYTPKFGTPRGLDVYGVTVGSVPLNLNVTMRQLSAAESISPEMMLFAPSGAILVDTIDTIDCTAEDDDRECVQMRLLAVEPGNYPLYVGGGSGQGRYTVTVASAAACKALALGALPAAGAITCPGQAGPGCQGVWYGDVRKTACAAPMIEVDGSVPEVGSPSDLYTFTANAGDVVHLRLDTRGDPYVYLLGPATAGNPLLAAATAPLAGDAEMTAALPATGTYTVVAANGSLLDPPVDDDEGDDESYELIIERMPP